MSETLVHSDQHSSQGFGGEVSSYPPIGRYIAAGLLLIALLIGGFFSWTMLAPLTSAVIAPGIVRIDTASKVVQHLEGGIISEILVSEGEAVKKGQVLLRLDNADALADINSVRAQISALEAETASIEEQLPGIQEQLSDQRSLYSRGYTRKSIVLELERTATQVKAQIASNESKLQALREQESKAEAKSRRNIIVAPQDGVVMNLRFHTVGGVISPGAEILDIVPDNEKLVLEVRIQPIDIDVMRPDLPATIRFVAYKQRTTPVIEGRVTRVSADATSDAQRRASGTSGGTGQNDVPYFLATVEVSPEEMARVPNVKLYPGMPIEAAIVTGEQTLLDFLIQPITDSFARAFREE